ncbi:S1 family peptidase [Streptomyces sp. SP18CS02]|uniref:S1 family peptidase n=1 Tax=Streptomyces sp. SP18CS02 TaxID=3002531 RepID=UPI002E76E0B6|nr:alpha-lytic protease prodomain-containing protein [Streptomyces sp. SP18CS02]MEE1752457.1 alpha-lytic protease prodomain-containing protein [Streptomyces sp. SP18CS02]
MKHGRRNLRRTIRLAAAGGLLCGGLMVTNAVAGETTGRATDAGVHASPTADLGSRLVARLGASRTAGNWTDARGRPVVAVTDEEAAAEVRRAGARAEIKRHSMRDLRSATETLSKAPRVPGTAWAMDYAANRVAVYADSSVSAADWSRMTDVVGRTGGAAHMERTGGSFTTRLNGAAPMLNGGGRCSAGFNVTDGRDNFVLTAGHCGPVGTSWFPDQRGLERFGTTVASSFPGADFSLIRYEDADAFDGTGRVDVGGGQAVAIVGAAEPFVGQEVFRSGSTTGLRSGKVTALNATVNYREGTVSGLIQTTVCAESGDSGGPLLAQGLALGVTSGGTGDCTSGGMTFFQPATTALSALGVRLIGGGTTTGDASGATAGGATGSVVAPPAVVPPGGRGSFASFTSIAGLRPLVPGLLVITVSLIGLLAVRWFLSDRADRRRYRRQYAQSWG